MSASALILEVFRTNSVTAGNRLHKRVVLDSIKASGLPMDQVRNAWHQLMGEGLIRQVGEDLELTERGGSVLYGSEG